MRWCDREVDGVYLGRSGWVQVQQRSLDECRRGSYANNPRPPTSSLELSRRTGIKLAHHHCNSEPEKRTDLQQRPGFLPIRVPDRESRSVSPTPVASTSPPYVTPIISPPPAFQDRKGNVSSPKSRSFFSKAPFLPRSDAIIDSDIISPPPSPARGLLPTPKLKNTPSPASAPESNAFSSSRIPQTKSLEDTTTNSNNKRYKFLQRHAESSSSSSSSMGFRSLDSCVNRPVMPRLSENTDSSIDIYEDADEEDNNSSSLNLSLVSAVLVNSIETNRNRDRVSPSARSRNRSHTRRSPAGSDSNRQANCSSRSSSSSSTEAHPVISPSNGQPPRRSAPIRQQYSNRLSQDDLSSQRVRRSRSLQLPDKKASGYREQTRVSPQHSEPHRVVVKLGNTSEHPKRYLSRNDWLREAEIVTEYVYGTRSRAAAQALLMHRYNNSLDSGKIQGSGMKPKMVQRCVTAPAPKPPLRVSPSDSGPRCSSFNCDLWPHYAPRDPSNNRTQSLMRSSQSYPNHHRSLDVSSDAGRTPHRARDVPGNPQRNRRELSVESAIERRMSPGSSKNASRSPSAVGNSSNSSSSSDVWLTTSDRTASKSPRNAKSSGASTPLEELRDERARESILTRPGSAPMEDDVIVSSDQRSMSLPKSFLSAAYPER